VLVELLYHVLEISKEMRPSDMVELVFKTIGESLVVLAYKGGVIPTSVNSMLVEIEGVSGHLPES
jgi:hypothetical protein